MSLVIALLLLMLAGPGRAETIYPARPEMGFGVHWAPASGPVLGYEVWACRASSEAACPAQDADSASAGIAYRLLGDTVPTPETPVVSGYVVSGASVTPAPGYGETWRLKVRAWGRDANGVRYAGPFGPASNPFTLMNPMPSLPVPAAPLATFCPDDERPRLIIQADGRFACVAVE